MTLDATVRVKYGHHSGRVGTVIAICDKVEYLVNFSDNDGVTQGYWIRRFRLEQL